MGHNPGQKVDYYSAGQEYFTGDDFDFPKLERDVLNSRLNANHDTRPQFEKTQEAALHIYKEKRSQATVKYMKYAFVTYRWVKSLSLASGALAGAITGLLLAVAPARVLKPDIISFLVVYFGSLFGLAMNVIEKPDGYEKL